MLEVTVTNSGKIKSDEVVQLYITHLQGGKDVPLYALKGFKRITLAPGASEKVSFKITPDMMKLVNEQRENILDPVKLKLVLLALYHLKEVKNLAQQNLLKQY